MRSIPYLMILLIALMGCCNATARQSPKQPSPLNSSEQGLSSSQADDISEILNQKLTQYEKSRRNFSSQGSAPFMLKYNRVNTLPSDLRDLGDPMSNQKDKVENFKNFSVGPGNNIQNFYGFNMKIPLDNSKAKK